MPTTNGGGGNGHLGNSRGVGPATPVLPDYLAKKDTGPSERQRFGPVRPKYRKAARVLTRRRPAAPVFGAIEADDAAVAEIEALFGRRLACLRRLPRHERPHALRAAREERDLSLKSIRDRRAYARRARYLLRQLRKPAPGQG